VVKATFIALSRLRKIGRVEEIRGVHLREAKVIASSSAAAAPGEPKP